MIRCGSNRPLEINVPGVDVTTFEALEVAFKQNDKVIFTKTISDCELEGEKVTVSLNVDDTLKLSDKCPVFFQMRVRFDTGIEDATNVMKDTVGPLLKGGHLDD